MAAHKPARPSTVAKGVPPSKRHKPEITKTATLDIETQRLQEMVFAGSIFSQEQTETLLALINFNWKDSGLCAISGASLGLLTEYIRFLFLKIFIQDCIDPPLLAPSNEINQFWFEHVLRPQSYFQLCQEANNCEIIPYTPVAQFSEDFETRYNFTRSLYFRIFRTKAAWSDSPCAVPCPNIPNPIDLEDSDSSPNSSQKKTPNRTTPKPPASPQISLVPSNPSENSSFEASPTPSLVTPIKAKSNRRSPHKPLSENSILPLPNRPPTPSSTPPSTGPSQEPSTSPRIIASVYDWQFNSQKDNHLKKEKPTSNADSTNNRHDLIMLKLRSIQNPPTRQVQVTCTERTLFTKLQGAWANTAQIPPSSVSFFTSNKDAIDLTKRVGEIGIKNGDVILVSESSENPGSVSDLENHEEQKAM